MGGIGLGFLSSGAIPQQEASRIIGGLTRKRKNEQPSAGSTSKKPRKPTSSTRPVITMVLHLGENKYQIRVLLDTGCLVTLINERTVEKLGLEQQKHKVA